MIRLFRVSIPSVVLLVILVDIVVLSLCFLVPAVWTLDLPLDLYLFDDRGAWAIGLVVVVVLVGLYLSDLYDNFRKQSTMYLLQQLCIVLGVELLIQSLLSYLRSPLMVSRWLLLYGSVLVLIALPTWRRICMQVVASRMGASKILFLGSSQVVQQIAKEITHRLELGWMPVGYIEQERCPALEALEVPYLGPVGEIERIAGENEGARLVVGLGAEIRFPVEQLLDLQFKGVPIEQAASTYETIFGRVSAQSLQASEIIFSSSLQPYRRTILLQNVYSLTLAVIGLVATLPVMAVVAVLVKLTSPGPVLFRQTRVGRNKKLFTLYKFRSMYENAEASTGAVWAVKYDPRITPLGRVLRNLRLDELPQFMNVIRGDMSLVGPRPERPEFVEVLEDQIPFFRQRMFVKPGITGWAQINHKYGDTLEDTITKLEYDLYYIKNLTPSLDALILFHTVKIMLLSRGAQ